MLDIRRVLHCIVFHWAVIWKVISVIGTISICLQIIVFLQLSWMKFFNARDYMFILLGMISCNINMSEMTSSTKKVSSQHVRDDM